MTRMKKRGVITIDKYYRHCVVMVVAFPEKNPTKIDLILAFIVSSLVIVLKEKPNKHHHIQHTCI